MQTEMNGKPARRDSGKRAGAAGENTGFDAHAPAFVRKNLNHSGRGQVNQS